MAMEFANSSLYNQQQKDQLAAGIGNWLALWYANRNSYESLAALVPLGLAMMTGAVHKKLAARAVWV